MMIAAGLAFGGVGIYWQVRLAGAGDPFPAAYSGALVASGAAFVLLALIPSSWIDKIFKRLMS